MLFVAIVPAAAFGTPTAQQSGNFNVSVAGTAVGSIPHQIDLKVTQLPGGQLSQVAGFTVSPEDVVQVKQGENLIVSTSPDLATHQVTVRNIQGIPIDLVLLPGNAWSLQGLLPGVYTLDVIADMSSSGILGTFETMLVILAPNQQPLPPTTVIEITIEDSLECPGNSRLVNGTCVEPPTPPPPPPPPPPCDPEEEVCVCPEGTTGTPPNCIPIICDVEDPPPECGEQPVVCPDGSTVSPGNECPEPPGLPPVNGGDGPPVNGGDGSGGDGSGGDGSGGDDSGGDGGGAGEIDIPSLFG